MRGAAIESVGSVFPIPSAHDEKVICMTLLRALRVRRRLVPARAMSTSRARGAWFSMTCHICVWSWVFPGGWGGGVHAAMRSVTDRRVSCCVGLASILVVEGMRYMSLWRVEGSSMMEGSG